MKKFKILSQKVIDQIIFEGYAKANSICFTWIKEIIQEEINGTIYERELKYCMFEKIKYNSYKKIYE